MKRRKDEEVVIEDDYDYFSYVKFGMGFASDVDAKEYFEDHPEEKHEHMTRR